MDSKYVLPIDDELNELNLGNWINSNIQEDSKE